MAGRTGRGETKMTVQLKTITNQTRAMKARPEMSARVMRRKALRTLYTLLRCDGHSAEFRAQMVTAARRIHNRTSESKAKVAP